MHLKMISTTLLTGKSVETSEWVSSVVPGTYSMDLAQLRRQGLHILGRGVAARETVERLLNVLQVDEDLARHLRAQLDRADFLDEVWPQALGQRIIRLSVRGIDEPSGEQADLLLQVRRRTAKGVEDMVGQEESGGHLDQQFVALPRTGIR